MAVENHITAESHVFVGDDRTFEIVVFTDHTKATVLDVSAYSLVWILAKTDKSAALIEKESGDGIAVSGVFNADPDLNTQKVTVTLAAGDSFSSGSPGINLGKKKYRYALKRVNNGARSTLMFGNFQFLQATTAAK